MNGGATNSSATNSRAAQPGAPGTGGLDLRERRVVTVGVAVLVIALVATYVLVPTFSQWRTRETRIERAKSELAQLRGLLQRGASIETAAATAEASLAGETRRVIHARSTALGASALQTLLQGAADASGLLVNRVDVAPELSEATAPASSPSTAITSVTATSSSSTLTATLSAYGDIHGLAALLTELARAPRLVTVERLTVQINPALRGAPDVLQIVATVRAPMVIE